MSNILRAIIRADVAKTQKQRLLKTASRTEAFLKRAQVVPPDPSPYTPDLGDNGIGDSSPIEFPANSVPEADPNQPPNWVEQEPAPTGNPSQQPAAKTWTGPRINPVFQTMLGVKPDGKLGPITQKALDAYKKSRNTDMKTNELAFEYLKTEPEYTSKQPFQRSGDLYASTANTQPTGQTSPQAPNQPAHPAPAPNQPAQFAPGGYRAPISTTINNKPASKTPNELIKAGKRADELLNKLAKKDKGHTGFVFPKTHPKVRDNKDHFPIGSEAHGRSALQEMGKYTAAPKWYSGSLEGLKSAISRAVHSKYPGIKSEKKK